MRIRALLLLLAVCGACRHEPVGELGGAPDAGEIAPGPNPSCGLNSCALQGASCGAIGDGCGGLIDCGHCSLPEICGGGGVHFKCGSAKDAPCVPRTCADVGANCGRVGDGCGGLTADCGTCVAPNVCGGGGVPNVCSTIDPTPTNPTVTCNAAYCANYCTTPGQTTTLSGTVVAATPPQFGAPDPIYRAQVFIPATPIEPFSDSVACETCDAELSGTPYLRVETGIDGTFSIKDAPCGLGIDLPLVIQLGRWRRQIILHDVACCGELQLTPEQTRLPRNRSEGDLPRIAISTGYVDALECVLRKMGIDDSEFANPALDAGKKPTSPARVHLYQADQVVNGREGALIDSSTPSETELWGSQTTLDAYDMVIFSCTGGRDDKEAAAQQRVMDYANAGGRVFTTHYSYVWLYDQSPWGCGDNMSCAPGDGTTATWHLDQSAYDSVTGFIDQTFQKGKDLASWLFQPAVGASTTAGQIPVNVVRHDFDAPVGPSQRWMYTPDNEGFPLHFTFDTPVTAAPGAQCGRVVYSDFHVENADAQDLSFPTECGVDAPLTPQEKLLEFMLYDLASCVKPDVKIPACTPKTCSELGAGCGPQSDGCGNLIDCNPCPESEVCGGGGVPNQCGAPSCEPLDCASYGAECGLVGDGCGGSVDCGACPPGLTCGGGGEAYRCGGASIL